jgi:hypothetical protein
MNVRLFLGLAPALFFAPANAQTPPSPLDSLFQCQAIVDDTARLACQDAAITALQGETESGEVVAVDREQIEAAEEATYGLSIPGFRLPDIPRMSLPSLSGNSEDLAEAAATTASPNRTVVRNDDGVIRRIDNLAIESIEFNAARRAVVTLQNGQVWRQTDSTHVQVSRRIPHNEQIASIRNGAVGSYFMKIGNGRAFRAERIG